MPSIPTERDRVARVFCISEDGGIYARVCTLGRMRKVKKESGSNMAELFEKIDEIPSGYENLSEEEIEKVCTKAIAALYKHRKEDCEIAFGGKKKC